MICRRQHGMHQVTLATLAIVLARRPGPCPTTADMRVADERAGPHGDLLWNGFTRECPGRMPPGLLIAVVRVPMAELLPKLGVDI